MSSNRIQGQIERLLGEAESGVSDRNLGGVRDRARAVLAFDPENVNAIIFESAALMAFDPPVIGKSAEKGPASVPSQPQPMFFND